jgi:hypothetical protein
MYKIKTYLPTLSTFCYVEEFTNKNYIDINKYIFSNDDEGLSNILTEIVGNNVKSLYDILFVLIYLRMLSVGGELKLKYSDNTGFTSSLSVTLETFLKRFLQTNFETLPVFKKDDLVIKFKEPTKLFYKNIIDLLLDIVKDIKINNKISDYLNLKVETKRSIISRLKEDIIQSIKVHIKDNSQYCPLAIIEDKNIFPLNLYNNTPIKLVKLMFKNNLSNLYLKLYHSVNKLNLTYADYISMTPAEIELLLNIYKTSNNIK